MGTNNIPKQNNKPAQGQPQKPDPKGTVPSGPSPGALIWMNILVFWMVITVLTFFNANQLQSIPYSQFLSELDKGAIAEVTISQHEVTGKYKGQGGAKFITQRVDADLAAKLAEKHVTFSAISEDNFFKTLAGWVVPAVIFAMVWFFMIGRLGARDGMGGPLMNIERNKARVYVETDTKVTFADVAGVDEAKEELQEVINFLKEPEQYSKLGAHLPKGILLVGPPGTGKTLLARAVAGEAGVPFFSISGSEFVELYVGVGAARVRDLFAQAQQKAPCIIFIDELDALGRARGLNPVSGAHDEKEQTLNQLLVELDGFDPRQGVVLLAATNRPEIIDTALLRAGRFDRHIVVDRPDKLGRVQILKVHLKGVTSNGDVDLEEMAAQTPGFTGADLANLVNEAVLLAARRKASTVCQEDFAQALERIIAGPEKKNRLLNVKERTTVAYHEIGHALVAMSLPGSDPVQKVSIIPRGIGALGYTIQRPTEDRFLMSKSELENKMTVLLGGRAAEMIVFGESSTGAADDFAKATDIARSMVTKYGMLDKLGLVAYESDPSSFLQIPIGEGFERRNFSEDTAREIDWAVRNLIDTGFKRAVEILKKNRQYLEAAAQELLRKETLSHEELVELAPAAAISLVPEPAAELDSETNGDRGEGRKTSKLAV